MTPEQALMKAMAMSDSELVAALQKPFVDSNGESFESPIGIAAAKRIVQLRDVTLAHYRHGLFEAARLMENAFGDKHAGKAIRALAERPPQ